MRWVKQNRKFHIKILSKVTGIYVYVCVCECVCPKRKKQKERI